MARSDCAPKRCAIYTRKSSRRAWTRTSIRCMRSVRPAKHSSTVRPERAGARLRSHSDRSFALLLQRRALAGPPPATSTSQSRAEVIVTKMSAKTICLKGPGTEHPRLRRFDPATGRDRASYVYVKPRRSLWHVLRARV